MKYEEFAQFGIKAQQACDELIAKHAIAVELLTERQVAEALLQALKCGDFIRNVRVDNQAQSVTYIPFAREQELEGKLKEARSLLRYVAYFRLPLGDKVFDLLDFDRQQEIHSLLND